MKKFFSIFWLSIFAGLCSANVFAQTEKARLIDEFGEIPCDEYLARADAMIAEERSNPNARIYVLVYEGNLNISFYKNGKAGVRTLLPQYRLAETKIESMKKYLAVKKIPPANYVFVNGGLRENFTVEIWLVPPGAEPPKPTPTLQKIKYRKGRPIAFCTSCCG